MFTKEEIAFIIEERQILALLQDSITESDTDISDERIIREMESGNVSAELSQLCIDIWQNYDYVINDIFSPEIAYNEEKDSISRKIVRKIMEYEISDLSIEFFLDKQGNMRHYIKWYFLKLVAS
jgi:hypothetical protein